MWGVRPRARIAQSGEMMSRVLVFIALIALIAAVPVSHVVAAKAEKVSVCHVNSANTPGSYAYDYSYSVDYTDLNPNDAIDWNDYDREYETAYEVTYHLGQVIEVSENALDAHLGHGDSTVFYALTEYAADWISSLDDIDYEYSYSYSYTYPNYYSYEYEYEYSRDGTSGVVKNADCYWTSIEYPD